MEHIKKSVASQIYQVSRFRTTASKVFNTVGTVNDIASITYDVSSGVYNNIQIGESWDKITYDAFVDLGCSSLPVAVATVGTCIGGPLGTAIGFAVGLFVTYLIDGCRYDGRYTAREYLKSSY